MLTITKPYALQLQATLRVMWLTPHDLHRMLESARSLWVWEPLSPSSSSHQAPDTSCPLPLPSRSTHLCPAGTRTSRCPSRPSHASVWCLAPPPGRRPALRALRIPIGPRLPRGSVPATHKHRSLSVPPPTPRLTQNNWQTVDRRLRVLEDSRNMVEEGWEGGLLLPRSQGACSPSRSLKWKEKSVRSDTWGPWSSEACRSTKLEKARTGTLQI